MLRLLLTIMVAWFSLSLLCVSLWALLIELALRRRARQVPAPVDTSPQDLSEREVEALLATPVASAPPGTHERASQRVRDVMR